MKAYPNYSDTSVDWLSSLPSHWMLDRLKKHADCVIGLTYAPDDVVEDGGTIVLRSTNIQAGRFLYDDLVRVSIEIPERLRLRDGDILVCSRNGSRHLIGKNARTTQTEAGDSFGAFTTVVRGDQTGFFYWLLNSNIFEFQSGAFLTSTINQLTIGVLKNIAVPVPSLPEQRAIAGFLDRETAKIDALVEEQRRLIALLKEKRQAVISHAVTKGLDPAAPMKPSGIDWLGDIPAHWEAVQAKRFVSVINGYAFPSSGFKTDENAVRLLRGINVGVGEVRWDFDNTARWTRKFDDNLEAWEMRAGDLVLGMDRPWDQFGSARRGLGREDVPSLLLQRVAALRTQFALVPAFLYRQLQSEAFVHHFLPETTGVSVPHISPSQIGSFVITVPPRGEQDQIVRYIDERIKQFSELEAEATRAIVLLQERRSALISAAVTGKIDVRDTMTDSTEAA